MISTLGIFWFSSVPKLDDLVRSQNLDGNVKSPFCPIFVIPAKAGIQLIQAVLDSGFHRSDDFLRDNQTWKIGALEQ